jgi:hypothetical protein
MYAGIGYVAIKFFKVTLDDGRYIHLKIADWDTRPSKNYKNFVKSVGRFKLGDDPIRIDNIDEAYKMYVKEILNNKLVNNNVF